MDAIHYKVREDKQVVIKTAYVVIGVNLDGEKEVLGILIEFPRDFYSIVDDYYNKRKSWDYDVFLNRLLGKLDNESFRYEFLETYNKMLNKDVSQNK